MNSVLIALSLAGAAAAQIVAGSVSMVPASQITTMATAANNQGYYGSSSSSATSSADSSVYTQPPATDGGASMMPYSSFMSGGYKSMNCGYGYTKGSDGSCQQMSWVSSKFFDALFRALIILCSTKPRAVTRRSSSTSESLIDAPYFRRVCSQTSSSGGCSGSDCGSYNNGYNNNCGGMSTVTKTMTDTMTVTKTMTDVSRVFSRFYASI